MPHAIRVINQWGFALNVLYCCLLMIDGKPVIGHVFNIILAPRTSVTDRLTCVVQRHVMRKKKMKGMKKG